MSIKDLPFKMNLQMFAEPGEPPNEPPAEPPANPPGEPGEPPKTFTQEEVNRMMKVEKDSGRRSILKELGIEDTKNAKDALAKYQAYLDSQKTDLEKANDTITTLTTAQQEAIEKAQLLENKFEAISLGANKDTVDDVVTLAKTKVSDEKDFKTALSEIKEKYPTFFSTADGEGSEGEGSTGNTGTGNSVNGGKKNTSATEGIGARLAGQAQSGAVKSSYFSK